MKSNGHLRRSLTPLYCLHQAAFFFAIAGIGAFAVTYLMNRGFSAATIGVMLASTNILSCILQPLIGSVVDRTSVSLLHKIIIGCLGAALISLSSVELFALPQLAIGLLYVTGNLTFSITIPLCNSLCAYYAQHGYQIDYGAGSGIGSLSFSFASLAFGYIIAHLGTRAMIVIALCFIALQLVLTLRYPKVEAGAKAVRSPLRHQDSLSIPAFCRRYKMFMATMLGVICLAACHSMAENYLIQIFGRIGGGSEHVGVTLFIACITAAPFLLLFERIQRRIGVTILLRLSGVFYIIKAALLIWAPTIASVYVISLLQTCTYCFLYPSLYYLAIRRIDPADMAKGQTLASAMYTLGVAMGNSLGGAAIEGLGLSAMLALAAMIAFAGTLLINATICRADPA